MTLSREEGEALRARLEANTLTPEDRRVLGKVLTFHFWLVFALREAKLSLKRLKALVFGEKPKAPKPPSADGTAGGGGGGGSNPPPRASPGGPATPVASLAKKKLAPPGHGRHGAEVSRAAQTVAGRHEELAVGERCPACGRGTLYRLPPGVEMRLDGNALWSAVRYELEKLRCSACGQSFTAAGPAATGTEKYTARARAGLALARYSLGLPWHRREGFPALVGVPVPDATQGDQGELVGDCTHPIFKCLAQLATQGEVIFQADTPGRVLALIEENQTARAQARAPGKAKADTRTGRQTTAFLVQVGERRICLYYTGRRHAGENLERLLAQREPGRSQPLVRSDALSPNQAEETNLIRCQCLAQGRRQFSDLAEDFPAESAVVVNALKLLYDPDEEARDQELSAPERLAYPQEYRAPGFTTLKTWLEQQTAERFVEPNSS